MIDSNALVSAQLQESTPRNEDGFRVLVAVASFPVVDMPEEIVDLAGCKGEPPTVIHPYGLNEDTTERQSQSWLDCFLPARTSNRGEPQVPED